MSEQTDFEIFCNNYRRLRKERRVSIAEIAKETDLCTWTLMCVEACTSPENVDCNTMLKLCDYFGVTIIDMFTPEK